MQKKINRKNSGVKMEAAKSYSIKEAIEFFKSRGISKSRLVINRLCRMGFFPNAKKIDSCFGSLWEIPEIDLLNADFRAPGRPFSKNKSS
jgi:hypothetical protein